MGNNIAISRTKTGLLGMATQQSVAMLVWDGIPDNQLAGEAGTWLKKNREDNPAGSAFLSIMAPGLQMPGKDVQDTLQANINPNILMSDAVAIVILGTGLKTSAVRAFLATTLFILNRTSVLKGQPPRTFATVADAATWVAETLAKKGVTVDPAAVDARFQQVQDALARNRMQQPLSA